MRTRTRVAVAALAFAAGAAPMSADAAPASYSSLEQSCTIHTAAGDVHVRASFYRVGGARKAGTLTIVPATSTPIQIRVDHVDGIYTRARGVGGYRWAAVSWRVPPVDSAGHGWVVVRTTADAQGVGCRTS